MIHRTAKTIKTTRDWSDTWNYNEGRLDGLTNPNGDFLWLYEHEMTPEQLAQKREFDRLTALQAELREKHRELATPSELSD